MQHLQLGGLASVQSALSHSKASRFREYNRNTMYFLPGWHYLFKNFQLKYRRKKVWLSHFLPNSSACRPCMRNWATLGPVSLLCSVLDQTDVGIRSWRNPCVHPAWWSLLTYTLHSPFPVLSASCVSVRQAPSWLPDLRPS